jgi:hypothetical protein
VRWLAALALCACTGAVGTIEVELTSAPGAQLLDAVQRLRLTLTVPRQVTEATRTGAGFALALALDAATTSGSLIVEGFDAGGALVACGQSPGFPVAALSSRIAIYMAAPRSIGPAPVGLPGPRSELAGTPLDYGVVLAGGRDPGGAPSTYLAIYNAFVHTLIEGSPLPAARAQLAMATGSNRNVYLFGGTGPDATPTGTLWRFDTTTPPSGAYTLRTEQPAFARTGQLIVPTASEQFLVTGAPPLELTAGKLVARTDLAALPAAGASTIGLDGTRAAIFAGIELYWFRLGGFDTLPYAGRDGASVATLPDGRVVVIGGALPSRDLLVVDSAPGAVTAIPDALAIARTRPALAVTSRHLLVVGGTDAAGAPLASAELFDAATLARLATLAILARAGAYAVALPNDQVLIAGGTPASSVIELFTPEPPPE